VESAKKQGGDDNITCLLVRLVDLPWYRRIFLGKKGNQQWQNSI